LGYLGEDPEHVPTLAEAERILILRAMEVARGHKGRVCQMLGISRPTLERKLEKYAILPQRPARDVI
ncbi:MAG TPA: helix-turn-helix domain-containing protein, partial [Myxococcaceae bacterium]|nr:helix-turn-helix domain-containing protein [Myxococcaceae bacterium]